MRRAHLFAMTEGAAWQMLAESPTIHIAGVGGAGEPILRVVNAVVLDGAVYFHGAPVGEKMEFAGRPVVVAVERVIASVPSYFLDAERACPATTLYESVQAHGVVEVVVDTAEKARALQALMEKLQPEGGHVPVRHDDALYAKTIAGLLVARIRPTLVDGKAKLGQNRNAAEVSVLLERLWRRGAPGDARAVDLVRAANPAAPLPAFLDAPVGARLLCAVPASFASTAVELLRDAYWQTGVSDDALRRAHVDASAWVGAVDGDGALIATARAVSDGGKWAGIFDVMVAPAWRGRGVGKAVVRLLVDHPMLRDVRRMWLATRDAAPFYAQFGFVEGDMIPNRPYPTTQMVRVQAPTRPSI